MNTTGKGKIGFYAFPQHLENPDGRSLITASYLLKRNGYTRLSAELERMALELLREEPDFKPTIETHTAPLMARIKFAFKLIFVNAK